MSDHLIGFGLLLTMVFLFTLLALLVEGGEL